MKFVYSFIAGVGLFIHSILFHFIPFCSILFHFVPFYSILFHFILFYSILFRGLKIDNMSITETSIKVAVVLRDVAIEVCWKRCHPKSDLVKGWYKYVQV